MRNTLFRTVSALAILTASPSAAQVAPPPAPQVWEADWVSSHCTISTGDQQQAALALWMLPGDPDPEVYFVGSPGVLPSGSSALTLTLLPGGRTFEPRIESGLSNAGRRVLKLTRLRDEFPAAFAASSEIRLAGGGKPVTLPITAADKAMVAVRQCVDSKLPEWGVDAKAFDALRKPPTDIEGASWISYTDYPADAADNNQMGTVIARMSMDATGRVTACNVVVSSGTRSLDDATCRAALKRGQFHPAIGADGAPTAAQRIVSTIFRLSN